MQAYMYQALLSVQAPYYFIDNKFFRYTVWIVPSTNIKEKQNSTFLLRVTLMSS